MVGNHSNKKEEGYDGRGVCNCCLFFEVILELELAKGS